MARKLKDEDLFVVQLQPQTGEPDSIIARGDEILSVSFATVRDSAVHIAYPAEDTASSGDLPDSAGLVYPGRGFYYDENTGRMDVKIDSDLKFVDVLTQDTPNGTVGGPDTYGPMPSWDNSLLADGTSATKRGNFFVVGEENLYLTSSWLVESGTNRYPNLGDLVICINDHIDGTTLGPAYRDTHLWNVIPSPLGSQAVLQITSGVPSADALPSGKAIEINTADPNSSQRPRIRIREAGELTSSPGTYLGGLISNTDMKKLGETPTDLINDGFIFDFTLDDQRPTSDALHMDTVAAGKAPNDEQFKGVILEITAADDSVYGVVELANQTELDDQISGSGTMPSSLKSAMTPRRTVENFVPRLFNTLQSLETLN